MELAKAQSLQPGAEVLCPADRGDPSFYGRVVKVGTDVCKTHTGSQYVWVLIRQPGPNGHKSTWPSNRLG